MYTHITKIKTSKITAKCNEVINQCKKVIEDLKKMYLADISNNVTFQKVKNESIYEELVDFPIKYTGNSAHQVTKEEFTNVCKIYNINDNIVKDTINKLDTDPFVKSKSIIYGIVNCDFITDFDTEEEMNTNILLKEVELVTDLLDNTEIDDTEVAEGTL